MSDPLTSRALSTASALLSAAAIGDRIRMREILDRINAMGGSQDIVGQIIREVCTRVSVPVEDVMGGSRVRPISHARFAICYAAHLFGVGSSHTARQLGIDHTSVIHGVKRAGEIEFVRELGESVAISLGYIVREQEAS